MQVERCSVPNGSANFQTKRATCGRSWAGCLRWCEEDLSVQAVLGWLVERVAGETISAYMTRKIWEPIGAEADGFFIMDGLPRAGREFTGAGFNAVLRDYARFGQMVLNGGEANGHRIVSSAG